VDDLRPVHQSHFDRDAGCLLATSAALRYVFSTPDRREECQHCTHQLHRTLHACSLNFEILKRSLFEWLRESFTSRARGKGELDDSV